MSSDLVRTGSMLETKLFFLKSPVSFLIVSSCYVPETEKKSYINL